MLVSMFTSVRNSSGKTLIEELEDRGFDTKRLLFSVPLKETP